MKKKEKPWETEQKWTKPGELEKTKINKMKTWILKKTEEDGKKGFRLVYSKNSQKLQKSSQKLEKKVHYYYACDLPI